MKINIAIPSLLGFILAVLPAVVSSVTLTEVSVVDTQPPVTDGLIVHWAGEGNTLDSSGNNFHGTSYNGVSFSQGVVGQAFNLPGGGQYAVRGTRTPSGHIESNNSLSLGSAYTVAMFLRPNETSTNPMWGIIFHRGGSNSCEYEPIIIIDQQNSPVRITTGVSGCNASGSVGTVDVQPGEWIHYAHVSSGSEQRIYVNGQEALLVSNRSANSASGLFYVGAYRWGPAADGYGFQGLLDELTIYNRALSDVEILELSEAIQPDTDEDGIPDNQDNCPFDSNPLEQCLGDTDCLGPNNSCNLNNGFCVLQHDNDGDSEGDICDLDDDNDGIADEIDNCPTHANSSLDIDGNGVFDALSDGIVIIRFAFGFGGDLLIYGKSPVDPADKCPKEHPDKEPDKDCPDAIDAENCTRCTPEEIEAYIEKMVP